MTYLSKITAVLIVIVSCAIFSSSAGAFQYSGNWYTYPNNYLLMPPTNVYTYTGFDKGHACTFMGNYPPENGMWPACWYGAWGPEKYVCITVINQYWEIEVPWECGWGSVSQYDGGVYGWPLMASTIPYQDAQFYQLVNWPY